MSVFVSENIYQFQMPRLKKVVFDKGENYLEN